MLIDSHCHLDAVAFASDRQHVIESAFAAGVQAIVIPAVSADNWLAVQSLAAQYDNLFYAVGIHPLYVSKSKLGDLSELKQFITDSINDPKLVAIGEIGLDFYLTELKTAESKQQQEYFYNAQLALAAQFNLPVLLHLRRSQDRLLKYLRRYKNIGGIAHAFNGSLQQAQQFINLGFALGVGGAMTFARAKQIRRVITSLPMDAFVLETDAPDMAPEWLVQNSKVCRNQPAEIIKIAEKFADLRGIEKTCLIKQCAINTQRVLPRLKIE